MIVPERADIPPVEAAMFVDFDLQTKILNFSLIDKYQSRISRTPNSNYFSLHVLFQNCTEALQNLP